MALLVDDLPIEGAVKDVLRKSGIVSLYPPQEAAIKAGALEGRNLVLASPTASGKTLVAELCALRHVLEMNGKVLYLTPLRALAQEKYETFLRYRTLRKRSGRPIRVGISTGDYDSSSPWLGRFDVIIATNEKCLAPSEEVIVIDRDGVDVTPIGELFDVLAKDSTAIRRGNVIDLVPTSAVYTLSYDEKRNKVVISEVECVTKVVNDREGLVRLRLETGRELLATADHKVFAMREGELAKVESGGALGEPVAVLRDSRGVFHGRLAEEDVLRRLCENGMARSFFGEFDGEVDPDRLARALVNDRRPYRRARELAKYYLKIRAAPLSAIVDIADEIGVREIRGLRRDSAERVPRLLRLTEDLGKILGYYVSEGTLCSSKKPYGYRCLRLSVESGWVAHDIVRSIRRLGLPYKVRASSDGSRWEVRVVGRVFATLVGKVWRLGSSPSRKAIPRFAFFAPDAFVAGLVAGLLNGGAVPKPTAIEYPTRSRSLALQLALLLTRFDVHARICRQRVGGSTYWRVAIMGARNLRRLLRAVGKGDELRPKVRKGIEGIAFAGCGRDDQRGNIPTGLFPAPRRPTSGFPVRGETARAIAKRRVYTEVEGPVKAPLSYLKVIANEGATRAPEVYNLKTGAGNFFTAQGVLVSNCDSLLRHRAPWIDGLTLIIADEVHLLTSADRGPTLEVTLARLRQVNPDAQILALSATVRNAEEVAEWLKAEPITTDWRPVKLREGVYLHKDDEVIFKDGSALKVERLHSDPAVNVALNTVKVGRQALIFAGTRRRAVSLARKAASAVDGLLTGAERRLLESISDKILKGGEKTRLSELLAELVSKGSAFHHAGLSALHRKIIENAFRDGKIRVLTATPTLAAGVNLPARTVVVSDYRRYVPGYGSYPISVLEYKQMVGRAGRPQFDEIGEAVLISRTEDEQDYLMEEFVYAKPERLWSKLAVESILRSHVLATVATGFAHSEKGLMRFLGSTFYAYQYGLGGIKETVNAILDFLTEEGMLRARGSRLYATRLGRRVSELYIDPVSAVTIRDGLERGAKRLTDFSFLHMVCRTPDLSRRPHPSRKEVDDIRLYIDEHADEFMFEAPDEWVDRVSYGEVLREVKAAMVLEAWINEVTEAAILERFNVEPGDLYYLTETANWLLYATREIADLLGHKDLLSRISTLKDRVKHGVKEEIAPLARLRGIGRVRARMLYNSGFRTMADLRRASLERLASVPLIGMRTARGIKEQVGGLIEEGEWKRARRERDQKRISEFIS